MHAEASGDIEQHFGAFFAQHSKRRRSSHRCRLRRDLVIAISEVSKLHDLGRLLELEVPLRLKPWLVVKPGIPRRLLYWKRNRDTHGYSITE